MKLSSQLKPYNFCTPFLGLLALFFHSSLDQLHAADKVAIAIVIDDSGSMDQSDRNLRRLAAARMLVFQLQNGSDYAAAVRFDSNSIIAQSMTTSLDQVENALTGAGAGGGTDYAPALQDAYKQLDSLPGSISATRRAAILISDGEPYDEYNSVLNDFQSKGWKIYTVGFAEAVDSVMQNIANTTGGSYFKVSTEDMQVKMFELLNGLRGTPGNQLTEDTVSEGETISHPFNISSTARLDWVKFTAIWDFGTELEYWVKSPSGKEYKETFSDNQGVYTINNPEAGNWTVYFKGINASSGTINVHYGNTEAKSELGAIQIYTSPLGGTVRIGNQSGSSGTTFENIDPGSHSVYGSKSGYRNNSKTINVQAGQLTSTTIFLSRKTGTIKVTANPSGTQIQLNSGSKYTAPKTFSGQSIGHYTVTASKSGYISQTSPRFYLSDGETENISFDLQPQGSISVNSPASNAFYVAGQEALPIRWTATDLPGDVKIELYRKGLKEQTIASSHSASSGSLDWDIPHSLKTGSGFNIRITSLNNAQVQGSSPSFSIGLQSLPVGALTLTADQILETDTSGQWLATGSVQLASLVDFEGTVSINKTTSQLSGSSPISIGPIGILPKTQLHEGNFQFNVTNNDLALVSSEGLATFQLSKLPVTIEKFGIVRRQDIGSGQQVDGLEISGKLGLPKTWKGLEVDFGQPNNYLRLDKNGIAFSGGLHIPRLQLGVWGLKDATAYMHYKDPERGGKTSFKFSATLTTPHRVSFPASCEILDGQLNLIGFGVEANPPGIHLIHGIFFQEGYGELYDLAPGPPPWGMRIGRINPQTQLLDGGASFSLGPRIGDYSALTASLGLDINSSGRIWGSGQFFTMKDFELARGDIVYNPGLGTYIRTVADWEFSALAGTITAEILMEAELAFQQDLLEGELTGSIAYQSIYPWPKDAQYSGTVYLHITEDDADPDPDQYAMVKLISNDREKLLLYDFKTKNIDFFPNARLLKSIDIQDFLSTNQPKSVPKNTGFQDIGEPMEITEPGTYHFMLLTPNPVQGFQFLKPNNSIWTSQAAGDSNYFQTDGKGASFFVDITQADLGHWQPQLADSFDPTGATIEIFYENPLPAFHSEGYLHTGQELTAYWSDQEKESGTVRILLSEDTHGLKNSITLGSAPANDPDNVLTFSTAGLPAGAYNLLYKLDLPDNLPQCVHAGIVNIDNPSAPPAPDLPVLSSTGSQLSISVPNLSPSAFYEVELRAFERPDDSSLFHTLEAGQGTLHLDNLQPGLHYRVRVRAMNADSADSSQWSPWAEHTHTAPAGQNTPPSLQTLSNGARVGQFYGQTLLAIDPDGHSITYSKTTGPVGLSITNTGQINWTPSPDQIGWQTLEVQATDALGASDSRTYRIRVARSDDPADFENAETLQFSDPEDHLSIETWGQPFTHTFRYTGGNPGQVQSVASHLPKGAKLTRNPDDTVTFRWTPGKDDLGTTPPIELQLRDGASEANHSFTVYVSDLTAYLSHPVAESRVSGTIEIRGASWAQGDYAGGRLEMKHEDGNYNLLTNLQQPVEDATLYTLDTTQFPDGNYRLRLRTFDFQSFRVVELPFHIDNSPIHLSEITQPEPDSYIRGSLNITGTCRVQPPFASGKLEIKSDGGNYTLLRNFTQPIDNGNLFPNFDTTQYSDGKYWIRLTANDTDSGFLLELPVFIDNSAPQLTSGFQMVSQSNGYPTSRVGDFFQPSVTIDESAQIVSRRVLNLSTGKSAQSIVDLGLDSTTGIGGNIQIFDPGEYRLEVKLQDLAGNTTDWISSDSFTILEGYPKLTIEYPSAEAQVAPDGNKVRVHGYVLDPMGSGGSVHWRRPADDSWQLAEMEADWRGLTWSFDNTVTGFQTTVEVRYLDATGALHPTQSLTFHHELSFFQDSPIAYISGPEVHSWRTSGTVSVTGEVSNPAGHDNFQWSLEYQEEGSASWTSLVQNSTTPKTGQLATFSVPANGGTYHLRLTASNSYNANDPVETIRTVTISPDSLLDWNGDGSPDHQRSNLALPVISHQSNTITLHHSDPAVRIHYTTDGSVPDLSSSSLSPGQSFTLNENATIKARAFRTGWTPSATAMQAIQISNDPEPLHLHGNLDFGTVRTGETVTRALVLENTRSSLLNITGLSLPTGFSTNWTSLNLPASQSRILDLTFTPVSSGDYSGQLDIQTDLAGTISRNLTAYSIWERTFATREKTLAAKWYGQPWFGTYFRPDPSSNWIYHGQHRWLYIPDGQDAAGRWHWDTQLGWVYTGYSLYPLLFRHSTSSWLYYEIDSAEPRRFYDYSGKNGSAPDGWLELLFPPPPPPPPPPYPQDGQDWEVEAADGLEMIWVDPDTFTMGSPGSEVDREVMKISLRSRFRKASGWEPTK